MNPEEKIWPIYYHLPYIKQTMNPSDFGETLIYSLVAPAKRPGTHFFRHSWFQDSESYLVIPSHLLQSVLH